MSPKQDISDAAVPNGALSVGDVKGVYQSRNAAVGGCGGVIEKVVRLTNYWRCGCGK